MSAYLCITEMNIECPNIFFIKLMQIELMPTLDVRILGFFFYTGLLKNIHLINNETSEVALEVFLDLSKSQLLASPSVNTPPIKAKIVMVNALGDGVVQNLNALTRLELYYLLPLHCNADIVSVAILCALCTIIKCTHTSHIKRNLIVNLMFLPMVIYQGFVFQWHLRS